MSDPSHEPVPELDLAEPAPDVAVPLQAAEIDEDSLRLAEALIFASASPVTARALAQLLPEAADAEAVLAALAERYDSRGVQLVEVAGGYQFRTAPDLAPRIRKVVVSPRRLPRAAMETLAVIAYHQPVTRPEIEEVRGTSLSQQTLDTLLEAGLVVPKGRKEAPGRPTLWATTPAFLALFGLRDLRDLPRREDLLVEPQALAPAEAATADQSQSAPLAPANDVTAQPVEGEGSSPAVVDPISEPATEPEEDGPDAEKPS